MTSFATVSLHGNRFEVDAALVGRTIDVLFTPFDLTVIEVEYQGRPMGQARPHHIGRHVHPAVKPDATAPVEATGIDYLRLLEDAHQREVGQLINYPALADEGPAEPGRTQDGAAGVSPAEPDTLAWLLRAHATGGRLADTAAIDLLISHRYWLARAAFTRFVHPVTTAEGHHIGAWIDWPAAITALQHGELPSSASEADMLRIAASLAARTAGSPARGPRRSGRHQHHRRDHRHHRRQRRLTTPGDPMLDKIQSFFGFTTMPFGRGLAPGMLFRSHDHAQAVARISYGITSRGITVITGEVGVGKTVAARAAIDRAEPARYHLIYIPDPTVGARGIYHHVVTALGGKPSFHNAALVPQARDALAAEHAERGRVPIVCIDEGHLLSHDALEALRLLTNHQLDTESPFATSCWASPPWPPR